MCEGVCDAETMILRGPESIYKESRYRWDPHNILGVGSYATEEVTMKVDEEQRLWFWYHVERERERERGRERRWINIVWPNGLHL